MKKLQHFSNNVENLFLLFLSLQFLHPFLDRWQQCCVHSYKTQGRWKWRVVMKCYNRKPSCAWKASHRKQKQSGISEFRRNNTFSFRNTVFTRQSALKNTFHGSWCKWGSEYISEVLPSWFRLSQWRSCNTFALPQLLSLPGFLVAHSPTPEAQSTMDLLF